MLIREAARLMYEEDIKQYHDAKQIAAKRIFGRGRKGSLSIRTRDLPSNGEIAEEVANLVNFYEASSIEKQLFSMRVTALDIMQTLKPFYPRLIGSVSTGKIRQKSDIDLHLFTDDTEQLSTYLDCLAWDYEEKVITIQKGGRQVDFTHLYLNKACLDKPCMDKPSADKLCRDKLFPVELSIYPLNEIRVRSKSSTDGKPIVRLSYDALLQKIIDDHGEAWSNYLTTSDIENGTETDNE